MPNSPSPAIEGLAAREREVLERLAEGLASKEVAAELSLTVETVRWYTKRIYKALGVHNRAEAVRIALHCGIGAPASPTRHARPLPKGARALVAREPELEALGTLLARHRLVSVTGMGGVGKTALVFEWARRNEARFRHGVAVVRLEAVTSDDALASVLAEAFGGGLQVSGDAAWAALHDVIAGWECLLLIDNFEQLSGCAFRLADILERHAGVQILVSSRQQLGLPVEAILKLEGLRLAAVELFTAEMSRLARGADSSSRELAAIGEICRLVDGLPLAIVLAASWTDVLPLEEIAGELRSGFALLQSDAMSPHRHRSLQGVIEATVDRQGGAQRSALAGLSVFHAGFTSQAALDVAGCAPGILAQLVRSSLVAFEPEPGRYRLHPLVQAHCEALLRAAGSNEHLRRAHQRYYRALLAGLRDALLGDPAGTGQAHAVRVIAADYQNIRAAFRHAVANNDSQALLAMAEPLAIWSDFAANLGEAVQLLSEAMESGPDRAHWPLVTLFRDMLGFQSGSVAAADVQFELALAELGKTEASEAVLLSARIMADMVRIGVLGDVQAGFADLLDLEQLAERIPAYWECRRLCLLSYLQWAMGEHETALATAERILRTGELAGDYSGAHLGCTFLTAFVARSGRLERMPQLFRKADELGALIHDKQTALLRLSYSGLMHCWAGSPQTAEVMIAGGEALGFRDNVMIRRLYLAMCSVHHGLLGDRVAAERARQQADVDLPGAFFPEANAWVEWGVGLASVSEGDMPAARRAVERMRAFEQEASLACCEWVSFEHVLDALQADAEGRTKDASDAMAASFAAASRAHDMYRAWPTTAKLAASVAEQ